ncbi:SPW repeat domain-containing protein [Sphingomonas sp. GlSt437]|uniref:SPW repeat domain-containing protein n=1 Tax=Sphingomonas sp. GlSt437 TaxID=3389970 RepID=UPI003A83F595
MKFQFLTPALHGVLDYLAAGALVVLPFLLGFSGIELWLSVIGGAGLIAYSLLTDYAYGAIKLVSFDVHLLLDLSAAVAFIIAPFVLGFGFLASIYYPVMAAGVVAVVALSQRQGQVAAAVRR